MIASAMQRTTIHLALLLSVACGTSTTSTSSPTPSTATPEPVVATPTPEPAPTTNTASNTVATPPAVKTATILDKEIVETAGSAKRVDKIKIRVDADGTIVKQSVYHDAVDKIPQAVRTLADTKFPGAKVLLYETELYSDIGRIYEVEVKTKDGKMCEVAASEDGKEHYTECQIATKELPPEITRAIPANVRGGKIVEAEKKTFASSEEYTVEVK